MISYFLRSRSCFKILITMCIAVVSINIISIIRHLSISTEKNQINFMRDVKLRKNIDSVDLKYILLWTPKISPLNKIILRGRDPFVKQNCKYTNCFLTHNKSFKEQTTFDAIVFSIKTLNDYSIDMPTVRLPKQKFIASSTELPLENNVMNPYVDNYFNWTWTFKLDSDILWRNFKIYHKNGQEIGPGENIKWLNDSNEISEEVEDILFGKTKAVVWYVTECEYNNEFKTYVRLLANEFDEDDQRISALDIIGNCSFAKSCGNKTSCYKQIENDYHFFIAFETDVYPDYVSENLLIAMQHYSIPVVFGSEMYSRFLPPGSFLDAAELQPKEMATEMNRIMKDYALYKRYFKWTNNYHYKSSESEICNICTALNDKHKFENVYSYKEFRKWWNGEETQFANDLMMSLIQSNTELQKALHNNNTHKVIDILKSIIAKKEKENIYIEEEKFNFSTTDTDALFGEDLNVTETTVTD